MIFAFFQNCHLPRPNEKSVPRTIDFILLKCAIGQICGFPGASLCSKYLKITQNQDFFRYAYSRSMSLIWGAADPITRMCHQKHTLGTLNISHTYLSIFFHLNVIYFHQRNANCHQWYPFSSTNRHTYKTNQISQKCII